METKDLVIIYYYFSMLIEMDVLCRQFNNHHSCKVQCSSDPIFYNCIDHHTLFCNHTWSILCRLDWLQAGSSNVEPQSLILVSIPISQCFRLQSLFYRVAPNSGTRKIQSDSYYKAYSMEKNCLSNNTNNLHLLCNITRRIWSFGGRLRLVSAFS